MELALIIHYSPLQLSKKKKKNLHYSQGLTLALMIKQSLFFLFQDSAYKTSLITAKDKTQEL